MNHLLCPPFIGPPAFVFFKCFSTLSETAENARVLDQSGREEVAFVLEYRRTASQVLELSTDLSHVVGRQCRIVWDDDNGPYGFHLDDILTRQVLEDLFQDFGRKVGEAGHRRGHGDGFNQRRTVRALMRNKAILRLHGSPSHGGLNGKSIRRVEILAQRYLRHQNGE